MEGAIDSHVHVWTNEGARYPRAPGAQEYRPERFTAEDFWAHAQPNGVKRAVLVQMSFYGFDNSYMLDSMSAHPGVFSGIAVVDSTAPNPDSAMAALARRGVRGFRIAVENSPQERLDTPGMAAMWRRGGEHRLAICPLINPEMLPMVGGICDRFPDTPVVIDHLARIGMDGEIRDSDTRLLCSLAKHKNIYVKVSAFYALGRKQAPYSDLVTTIRRIFEAYGPERLMWGSDCPFQIQAGHTYADSIALIEEGLPFLSGEDRAWLLARTAAAVFF